jgi:hypothetical protein
MSEIEKYKKYLNFKANPRYLRRDFIVPLYTGTEPDIVPETSVEQQGAVQEFNDGGRVERQGFAKGSVPPGYITGKELEELTGIPNLSVKAKELMYAPKEYKRQKNLFGDFYKKQLKAKYFDIGQGGKYGTLHYKKPTAEQIEIMKEYHLRRGAKYGVSKATADRMKLFHNDPKLRNYVRNGKLIPDELLKEYGVTRNEAAQSTFRLAQAYNGKKFVNVDVGIPKNRSAGKKLFEEIDKAPFGNPYKMAQYKEALNVITDGIGDKYFETTTFENMKREARRILQKEKIPVFDPTIKGSKGINVNELTGVTASSRNKSFPYSQFINLMEGNLNTKAYAGFNKQFEKYEKDLQNEIAKGNKGNPNKIIKEYKNYTKDFLGGLEDVDKAQIEKLGLPELSLKEPTELYGKKRTSQLLSQGLDLPGSYKELGYSIKVPKGTATLKEFISDENIRTQMISNIGCPNIGKALGGRVNFSEGSNCYAKGLEKIKSGELTPGERMIAGNFLKEAGADTKLVSSLIKGGKNALRLFQELTIGTGPVGVGVTAALTVPFALADLSEGKRGSEALSNATFGLIGRSEEDILKGIGGPKVSQGLEIENKFKRLEELENQYDNLENQIMSSFSPDDIMFGTQERMAPKMIESEKKRLDEEYNKTLDYLIPFLKKDRSELNPNAPGYKELLEARKLKTEEEKLRTEAGQARAYAFGIDDVVPQEKDGRINPMLERSSLLEKQLKEQEQKYYENQQDLKRTLQPEISPDDYLNEYQQYMSGGRVRLSEGGKGPKLSRRGFLGFLMGAASLPFVGKLMKGKKGVQAAKVATKVLPKVSGMPEWFPSLVARIEKEGIDISPKATRVEDIRTVKKIEVPVAGEKKPDIITMTQYPDGTIHIEADVYGGSFDSPFDLHYKPPKSDMDLETGKAINYPGEFSVMESRPRPVYDPHSADWELEYENMSVKDAVSDLERVEKIATGKRIHPKRVQQREKARVNVEENPYDDIINRYGEVDTPDWWDPND